MTKLFEQLLNVRSAYGATFDRDGQRLYFVSTSSGVPGLWGLRLGARGAWPEPLAVGTERVQYAVASPKSGRVLYGLDQGGNERTQLWLLDGVGARPRALTAAPEAIHQFGAWHQDGRQICYAANARDPRYFDLYLLDVELGEQRLVYRCDATNRALGFEPSGRRLLVQRIHTPFQHELLLVDPADGSTETLTGSSPSARFLSAQWSADGQAIYCLSDRDSDFLDLLALSPDGPVSRPVAHDLDLDDFALSPDGRWLAYAVNRDGYSEVLLWNVPHQRTERLGGPRRWLAYDSARWLPTFAWSSDSRQLALTTSGSRRSLDIYLSRLRSPIEPGVTSADRPTFTTPTRATRVFDAGLLSSELIEPELVHYTSFDGRRVPAFIYRPKTFMRDGSLPALLFVHGGPESQFRPSFNPVAQYFALRGFVVVAPNVRGSTGYGKAYAHLDDVERRLDAVADLAAGAEWLAARREVHPRRIAVMGASYGGYMVLAALTEGPDLWAAGVDIVGIANFVTFLERTGPWRRRHREAEYGSLKRDRALLERLSPLNRADRIVAPLLVIHGANDPRVPITEAEQIVSTLQRLGRPVEYLRFEDEGHGLARLDNRLVAYPRIAQFLEHATALSGQ